MTETYRRLEEEEAVGRVRSEVPRYDEDEGDDGEAVAPLGDGDDEGL
jgi:hypothetical protein